LTFGSDKGCWPLKCLSTFKSHYGYYANILGCSQKSMQILSTRSKVSLRRFFESFISNKQCKSYICDKAPWAWIWKLALSCYPLPTGSVAIS
jgi:hypothetical protein